MAKHRKNEEILEDVTVEEHVSEEQYTEHEESSNRFQINNEFFQNNKNLVYIIGGGILAIIFGIVFYRSYVESQEKEAQEQMVRAVQFFESDSLAKGLNGDGQYPGFITIADEYGGTKAGNLAKMYAGLSYIKQDKLTEGIEYLEDFSKGEDMVSAASYAALGAAHEGLKEFEEAADNFEKAAVTPKENAFTTPYFYMDAARNYEAAGDNDNALNIYKKIKKQYPLSQEGQEIDKYIARLADPDEE